MERKNSAEEQPETAHVHLNSWKQVPQLKHTTVLAPDHISTGLYYSMEQ